MSGVLKGTKGKREIKHSQRDGDDKPSEKWLMRYFNIQLRSPRTPRAVSPSGAGRQKILCLLLPSSTRESGTAHLVQQSVKKSAAQGEEGGFPVSPGKSRTSTIAQMQAQKPT